MQSNVMLNKEEVIKKKENRSLQIIKQVLKNKLVFVGIVIVLIQTIMAIFAPFLVAYGPNIQDLSQTELGVGSPGHPLGTDNYGRDLWSRLVYGARISLIVGLSASSLGVVGGVILGLLAGYYRRVDVVIMRFVDLLFAFPGILLAMLIIAILGPSLINVVIAISIWSIPGCARIVRGSVLSVKNKEYIQAMQVLGASDIRIMLKHILPNCTAPIIVFATTRLATAILSTAALSFIGLGAQAPTAEWGAMIASGQDFLWTSPHISIIPGVAIMLTVFGFNVIGDGLRDVLDPDM